MVPNLFSRLYEQASQNDAEKLALVQQLWGSLKLEDVPTLGRLATLLLDYHADFEDTLDRMTRANRWYVRHVPKQGMLTIPVELLNDPPALIQYILKALSSGSYSP